MIALGWPDVSGWPQWSRPSRRCPRPDVDDEESVVEASLPSYAPSMASGIPGDLDANEDQIGSIWMKPDWSMQDGMWGHMWLDGSWEAPTRSGGGTHEIHVGGGTQTEGAEEVPTPAGGDTQEIHGGGEEKGHATKAGAIGVLSGNWGGHWENPEVNAHMLFDVKSCPAHILTMQEAESELFMHLRGSLRKVFGRRDHGRPQLLHLPMVMGIVVVTMDGPMRFILLG